MSYEIILIKKIIIKERKEKDNEEKNYEYTFYFRN